ncbi:MAG: hypothetical protein ACD_60C00038G0017 [uncultured bacterium]|nr:MAG: hypothetical protein ACD_60C00038G0017 [uncultured bacterium]
MLWVVTTNSNTCRIYQFDKHPAKITLVKEINHPENKLKRADLVSDRPGRYKTDVAGQGAYVPHTDPKEVEINYFSKEIADALNHGRTTQQYKKLIMIAPPHMIGSVLQHLDKHTQDLIVNDIQKDVMHLAQHELLDFLKVHAQYEKN